MARRDQFFGNLEPRTLLSASIEGEILIINGTDQADAIVVEAGDNDGEVRVFGVDGVEDGTVFQNVNRLLANLGGGDDSFTINGTIRNTAGEAFRTAIFGNDGDDTITGGNTIDNIYGGLGNDTIFGRGMDDRLFGGDGDDTIYGNAGNDQIFAGLGNDTVYGGFQNDRINGGAGADTILGNQGSDFIDAGDGDDIVRAGNGRDTVFGGAGDDDLNGGFGNDTLAGGLGVNLIIGGAGDDDMFDAGGQGFMRGGAGADGYFGRSAGWLDVELGDRGIDFDTPLSDFDNDLSSDLWSLAEDLVVETGRSLPDSFADLAAAARTLNEVSLDSLGGLFNLASGEIGVQIASDYIPFGESGSGVIEGLRAWATDSGPLVTDFNQDGALLDFEDIVGSLDLMLIFLPQQQQAGAIDFINGIIAANTEFRAFTSAFDAFLADVQADAGFGTAMVDLFNQQIS